MTEQHVISTRQDRWQKPYQHQLDVGEGPKNSINLPRTEIQLELGWSKFWSTISFYPAKLGWADRHRSGDDLDDTEYAFSLLWGHGSIEGEKSKWGNSPESWFKITARRPRAVN